MENSLNETEMLDYGSEVSDIEKFSKTYYYPTFKNE